MKDISTYIENFITFEFNSASEIITFDNWEISQEVVFKNGNENELFMSENGKGFTMQNTKGRTFEFLIEPNQKYTTRKKWLRVVELTSQPYTLRFAFRKYLSYVPNFPPSTLPPYTESSVLTPFGVNFRNCVLSYQNDSTEKNKIGRGLRIGLDQSISVVVTESEAVNSLFPCANVLDSMFDFTVDSSETPPSSGFWYLADYYFFLSLSQTYIDSILQYPTDSEYWLSSGAGVPGAGEPIMRNPPFNPYPNKYNTVFGPYTYPTGTVITVQWRNVVLQLATGVICNSTTVTKTFIVG